MVVHKWDDFQLCNSNGLKFWGIRLLGKSKSRSFVWEAQRTTHTQFPGSGSQFGSRTKHFESEKKHMFIGMYRSFVCIYLKNCLVSITQGPQICNPLGVRFSPIPICKKNTFVRPYLAELGNVSVA